jgi:Zinc knuckle
MQGHKAIDCGARKQKMNAPSGNEVKNQKNKCYLCGKQGHYSKNCPEKKYNNMPRQPGLFVGHVGEDSVYMLEEVIRAHKTNRDWHLNSSSSDNMSDGDDSKPSAVNHLDNNNNNSNDNGNNQGINHEDFKESEDYEPTDGFHQKIIGILSWNHGDLVDTRHKQFTPSCCTGRRTHIIGTATTVTI